MAKPTFVFRTMMFLWLATFVSAQDVPSSQQPTVNEASRELLSRVISNQKKCDEALDVYERIERVETRKNAADAPSGVKILRVIPTGTGFDRIPVGPDGQPADADAYRVELEKLVKALTWNLQEGRLQAHNSCPSSPILTDQLAAEMTSPTDQPGKGGVSLAAVAGVEARRR